jgi:hypothetical protein
MKTKTAILLISLLAVITAGCATYYQKTQKFQSYILTGDMDKARNWIDKNEKLKNSKNELLYHMYRGWLYWIIGDAKTSNKELESADLIIEDYHKQLGYEALSLITNPAIKPYQAEDFEKVMVNYFKALNYLQSGMHDEAIVEARRIILKLQQLNSKYKEKKNRYSSDAFAHLMIGLIYEADGDYNNAFIAYRNAVETYESIYTENFNVGIPEQLKYDLLRSAYLTGFYDEVAYYEKKFQIEYEHSKHPGGELIVLWQNGFGPIKSEWSINFAVLPGETGFVNFTNEEYGLTFPFYIGNRSKEEQDNLRNLNVVRVAFPKYVERKPVFTTASLVVGEKEYFLELAQDINNIAFKTLQDRMIRELGNGLLRLATKKAIELAVREATKNESKEDKIDAGDIAPAAITLINAFTEKADTRNWQTLPYSISYCRIPLDDGNHQLSLITKSPGGMQENSFNVDIYPSKATFYVHQSLASKEPGQP